MKISVIMPVYNIEKYVSEAVNSILSQTFSDFELIILDDKSIDNTLNIAKKFAQKDDRIRVIELEEHQKQGVGRNIGIQEAKGEYIMFLDGDDIAEKTFLEKMYAAITRSESDIAMCKFRTLDDKTKKITETHPFGAIKDLPKDLAEQGFTYKDIKKQLFTIPNIVWNKIYKRDFILENHLELPAVITMCEDIIFGINATVRAKKIVYVDENLLLYRINRPKASSGGRDEAYFDNFTMYDILSQNFKDLGIYEEIKKYFITDAIYTLIWFLGRIKPCLKKRFFNSIKKLFEKFYKEEFSTEEKMLLFDATTYFHLNRVRKNSYEKYVVLTFLDKIFRMEEWVGGCAVVVFSKYEFWINKE